MGSAGCPRWLGAAALLVAGPCRAPSPHSRPNPPRPERAQCPSCPGDLWGGTRGSGLLLGFGSAVKGSSKEQSWRPVKGTDHRYHRDGPEATGTTPAEEQGRCRSPTSRAKPLAPTDRARRAVPSTEPPALRLDPSPGTIAPAHAAGGPSTALTQSDSPTCPPAGREAASSQAPSQRTHEVTAGALPGWMLSVSAGFGGSEPSRAQGNARTGCQQQGHGGSCGATAEEAAGE